jgi:hypothetical protein
MICIGLILERSRQLLSLLCPRLSATGSGKHTAVAIAVASHKSSLIADQRGAVAFEAPFILLFLFISLLFPLADVAIASFQYISAYQALRDLGQYVQYHPPSDVTNWSTWKSSLPTTIGIDSTSIHVVCGDAKIDCSSANTASPMYYTYTTSVTLSPMVLRPVLCNGNCTKIISYSEQFR